MALNDATNIQLSLIDELTQQLKQATIDHWLFGGWAVDFRVGKITRPHHDIDLVLWLEDAARAREVLGTLGYLEEPPPAEESHLHTHFSNQGQQMDVMFIYPGADGGIYWADWRWPDGAFSAPVAQLDTVTCPAVSGECLLEAKEGYLRAEPDPEDREKCVLDIAVLRSRFSSDGE
ncbi:MAG: hypothetical protein QM758_24830 [Armatimonas sp.]